MIQRIVVAGGGTGGHLFPGLAVVEELRRREPGLDVVFVGTARGIEARILPERGERLELVDVSPLSGRGPREMARGISLLPRAVTRAARLLREVKPDLVLGVGGYAAGPALAAAALLRLPTALLEQNAHVGLTNRMLAPLVGRAYVTFPATATLFGERRSRVTGNPVRRAFVDAARLAASDPEGFEARAEGAILVLGGSQGAKALNELVPEALARAGAATRKLRIVHQTGPAMLDAVRARYAALGVDAEVVPFIEDMARAYTRASIVIGRAGATTLAEICAIGRAAILVPFPHAAQDHQTKNAEALATAGAAVLAREENATADSLAAEVTTLLDNRARRRAIAEAARHHGRPDAAAAIVDDLCAWLGCRDAASRGEDDTDSHATAGRSNIDGHKAMRRPLVTAMPVQKDMARKRRPRVRTPRGAVRAASTGTDG